MKTTRWHKLRSLSVSEVWLLVEAAAAVMAFDVVFRGFPATTCLGFFQGKTASRRRRRDVNLQRAAWLADVADRYAPGRSSCLRQAAALAWLLRRRGVSTRLRIGVKREGEVLVAHAWLQSEEGELCETSEAGTYALLSPPTLSEPLQAEPQR